jgi:hypothetical protein
MPPQQSERLLDLANEILCFRPHRSIQARRMPPDGISIPNDDVTLRRRRRKETIEVQ